MRSSQFEMNMPSAADTSDTGRLFLALWPDQRVRGALVHYRDAWAWSKGAALVRPDAIHLTIQFIGAVPRNRLPQLQAGLAVPFLPFDLSLDDPELWPRGLAVLRPHATPAGLLALHEALGQVLAQWGIEAEKREFRPHVTFARRAVGTVLPPSMPAIAWHVGGYALVESMRTASGDYRVIQSYA